jgi:hypothetical protein
MDTPNKPLGEVEMNTKALAELVALVADELHSVLLKRMVKQWVVVILCCMATQLAALIVTRFCFWVIEQTTH